MKLKSPERNQSHMLPPHPTSAKISPQKDINGQQENSVNIANSPPQGLFLDAGESPLQGSLLLLGQGACGARGQAAEPQVEHFPAGRPGCCERWTKCYCRAGTRPSLICVSASLRGLGGTSGGTEDGDGKGKERALPLPCTCADYCRLIATPVVH